MGGTADGGQTVGQDASMMDTARDELAAYMAEAETMSQSFEEDERVWQAQHSATGVPNEESRGAESEQPPLVDRLHEASATSVTLLAQAEQARPASPTGQDAGSGEPRGVGDEHRHGRRRADSGPGRFGGPGDCA